jgi:chromosome segregation ATPase
LRSAQDDLRNKAEWYKQKIGEEREETAKWKARSQEEAGGIFSKANVTIKKHFFVAQEKVRRAIARADALEGELAAMKGAMETKDSVVEELKSKLEARNERIDELKSDLRSKDARIEELEEKMRKMAAV